MASLWVFAYLQLLDVLTTLVGFSLGAGEASPFVSILIRWGPVTGTLLSKVVAVALVVVCLRLERGHLVRWINCWYAALAVWNLCVILRVLTA